MNLIPLNPTTGFTGKAPSRDRVRKFADVLRSRRRAHDDPPQPGRRHRRRVRSAPQPAGAIPVGRCAIDHNGPWNERRFLNQFQPQTLVLGTVLCYLDAGLRVALRGHHQSVLLGLLTIVGLGVGGYGIANEKQWGYLTAVAAAVLQVVLLFAVAGLDVLDFPLILNLIFDGALVGLLLHPEARDYQRIWFK